MKTSILRLLTHVKIQAHTALVAFVIALITIFAQNSRAAGGYAGAVQADGPIAYWRFNDTPPTAVNSGSLGAAANGTYNGNAAPGSEAPRSPAFLGFEPSNTAVQLDGTGDFVGTISGLMNSRPVFTISGWMRRNADQADRTGLWGQNDLVEYGYINNSTLQVWTDNGLDVVNPIPNGEWAHLAIVSDGSPGTMTMYTNGVVAGSRGHSMPPDTAFPFNIGGGGVFDDGAANGNFFNGQIDEVAIFPTALTAAQIAAQYQAAFVNPGFNFDDCMLPPGFAVNGSARVADDGTGTNCAVHLTDTNQCGVNGNLVIPDQALGSNVDKIRVRWRSRVGGDDGTVCTSVQFGRPGADGYSFNWGTDLATSGVGEEGTGTGVTVTVDTFDNGGPEAPGLEIKYRGSRVAFDNLNPDQGLAKDFLRKNQFVEADLDIDVSGQATFTYDGRVLTATLAGWTGITGGNFVFGARTGGAADNHWIDDLLIEAFSPGRPFITRQPEDQTVRQGLSATFSASADGTPPLSYQWSRKLASEGSFSPITGATSPSYTTPPTLFPEDDNSQFKLEVSNSLGTTESRVATLHVLSDTNPPVIVSAPCSPDFMFIRLNFSEELEQGAAEDSFNYEADGGLSITNAQLSADRKTVTLALENPETPNTLYTVTAHVQDLAGNRSAPPGDSITFRSCVLGPCGGLIFEAYFGIGGTAVSMLTSSPNYPDNPDQRASIGVFDTRAIFTDNSHENYGGRLRGLFIPPSSGNWIFYLASDDASQLFLNPNGIAASGKVMIAEEPGCCGIWSSHVSAPQALEAGRGYYIEGLYKEGGGGDYLKVAARLQEQPVPEDNPNQQMEVSSNAIPGSMLGYPAAPAGIAGQIMITQPPTDQTVEECRPATFCVQADNPSGLFCYQWSLNGNPINGANNSCYTTPPAQLSDEGAVYSVTINLIGADPVSASARLHVTRDTTPAACTDAQSVGSLFGALLTFNEVLDRPTAETPSNYSASGGLMVTGASLDAAGTHVTLAFDRAQTPNSNYCVSVSGVKDCSGNPIPTSQPSTCCFDAPNVRLCVGVALRQLYMNIGGNVDIPSLTGNPKYPNSPDIVNFAELLEAPIDNQMQDGGDRYNNYGGRVSGYLIAPATGPYNFYISADDNAQFWLSTDANPAHKVLVAREPEWNGIRNWTGAARRPGLENQSITLFPAGIPLTTGQTYFFEMLYKEGGGGDNAAVTWTTPPGGPQPAVPTNSDGVDANGSGGNGNGGTKAILGRYMATLVPASSDTTLPSIVSCKQMCPRNRFVVTFSEIIRASGAENTANYSIPGATITSAVLRPDQRSVVLTTAADVPTGETLTVNNLEDCVGNTIAANTTCAIVTVGAYLASGAQNIISIEAEHFADVERQAGLEPWSLQTYNAGYCGDGFAEVIIPTTPPDNFRRFHGNAQNLFDGFGARGDYCVNFPVAGTYYIWVRGSTPGGNNNSFHMGLDGISQGDQMQRIGNRINNWGGTATGWGWVNDAQSAPARVNVVDPGVHTLNIWPREDGARLDKFVLTTDAAFTLAGNTTCGPDESARQDTVGPVMTCPTNVTAECTGGLTPVTWEASAVDAVDGPRPVTCTPPSGSGFRLGCSNVTCTATDNSGNTSRCTFQVCVVDTTPPRVSCPSDMTVEDPECDGEVVRYIAAASDSCGLRSFDCSPPSGSTFPDGMTTVTCTAADTSGNSNSCSFKVTVICPNQPPTCVIRIAPEECGMTFTHNNHPDGVSVIAIDGETACVILDGSGSSDPDNDPLTFKWTIDGTNMLFGAVVTNCFELGCHTVVLEVSDGRATTRCETNVCAIAACEAVEQCILLVESTPIQRKNKRPLIASLKAACDSFDRGNFGAGINQLEAFQHKVRAQVERNDPAAAQAFHECAQRIIDALDCMARHGHHGGDSGDNP